MFLILDGYRYQLVLKGAVQIDEKFYHVIESDKIMKDGKQLRGLSKNQYCIGIGYDETYVYAHLEGFGKTFKAKTLETFQKYILPGAHLIHDKEKSHRVLVNQLQLEKTAYNATELKH